MSLEKLPHAMLCVRGIHHHVNHARMIPAPLPHHHGVDHPKHLPPDADGVRVAHLDRDVLLLSHHREMDGVGGGRSGSSWDRWL